MAINKYKTTMLRAFLGYKLEEVLYDFIEIFSFNLWVQFTLGKNSGLDKDQLTNRVTENNK
ncbi:hypothetical protein METP2_03236 [Methanosarcinales archaeon]|nr:hypothetical protein [Candidatus Methanoperedens sp.]CAG1000681.1 hypothetical protein METP2_03236 [Methanosarcinales archaeon]